MELFEAELRRMCSELMHDSGTYLALDHDFSRSDHNEEYHPEHGLGTDLLDVRSKRGVKSRTSESSEGTHEQLSRETTSSSRDGETITCSGHHLQGVHAYMQEVCLCHMHS